MPQSRRSRKPELSSVASLDRARDRAAASPLRRKLALALARAGQLDEAREVLGGLLTTGPLDAETSGLFGRINKDLAARSSSAEEARGHLQTALVFYRDGYRRDGDAYCGINAASLHALLGEHERAEALAAELLDGGETEDGFWRWAIRAEALLLLGRLDEARKAYAACAGLGAERETDLQSAWAQARRLGAFLHGDAGLFDDCFGGCASEPGSVEAQLQALRETLEVAESEPDMLVHESELPTLHRLARELLTLQEEQRHALSRELHDNIAQCLCAATNRIALIRRDTNSRKLQRELGKVHEALEQTLDVVGLLSRSLRSNTPDEEELAAAIARRVPPR